MHLSILLYERKKNILHASGEPVSRKLKPPRNELLKHKLGIIPPLHVLQPLHIRRAVMPNDVLIITGIVHELVRQIAPVALCDVLDLRVHPARGLVRRLVVVVVAAEPVARIEYEPSLVDAFQAQGVAAASLAREDGAGGNGLQA